MICNEGKEVKVLGELNPTDYARYCYINNMRATAEQTLANSNIAVLILAQGEDKLKKFYAALYDQLTVAKYEETVLLNSIAKEYNVPIDTICIQHNAIVQCNKEEAK